MAMTITLVKGCPLNGTSYATNLDSVADQVAYINTFPFKTYNVNTTRLGESIRLGAALSEIMGYNYGYIDYGNGYYYFIVVTGASMITETQTEIYYTVDAYETLCNQGNLKFKACYLTKYPNPDGDAHLPTDPYYWVDVQASVTRTSTFFGIVSMQSSTGVSYPATVCIPVDDVVKFRDVLRGNWLNYINHDPKPLASDVYIFAMCPFGVSSFGSQWQEKQTEGCPYKIYVSESVRSIELSLPFGVVSSPLPWSIGAIRDIRKNVIWRCPIGHSFNVGYATLRASATSVNLEIPLSEGTDKQIVVMSCENVDLFEDSWKEYYYRLRDSEEALRRLGYEQSAWQSGFSSLTGGINGAMSGSLAGQSAGVGAVAGIGLGVVSSLGTYAMNLYYDPKLQEQYDRQAIRQADALSLAGDLTDDMFLKNWAGSVQLQPDSVSMAQYEAEFSAYGYDTVLYLKDTDPRKSGNMKLSGYMRGSVDISADAPREWLDQIASRFDSGIRFI